MDEIEMKNNLSLTEFKEKKFIVNIKNILNSNLDQNECKTDEINNSNKKPNENSFEKKAKTLNYLTFYSLRNHNFLEQFQLDSSSSASSKEWYLNSQQFVQQCLNRHNYYRRKHGVCDLKLSENLINYSKDWADILARNDRLERRSSNRYGENLFLIQLDDESQSLNGAIPVDHWYKNGINYNYSQKSPKSSTAKFTQLIWKSTKRVGFAYSRSKTNKIYVVASYSLSGNFPGQYIENVLLPIE